MWYMWINGSVQHINKKIHKLLIIYYKQFMQYYISREPKRQIYFWIWSIKNNNFFFVRFLSFSVLFWSFSGSVKGPSQFHAAG